MSDRIMQGCGIGTALIGGLGVFLGLALLASLIVLVWVAIGRLRGGPAGSPVGT
jgi:hypothetical protein